MKYGSATEKYEEKVLFSLRLSFFAGKKIDLDNALNLGHGYLLQQFVVQVLLQAPMFYVFFVSTGMIFLVILPLLC